MVVVNLVGGLLTMLLDGVFSLKHNLILFHNGRVYHMPLHPQDNGHTLPQPMMGQNLDYIKMVQ